MYTDNWVLLCLKKKKIKSSDLKRQRLKSFQVGFSLRPGSNEFHSLTAVWKRINLG